MNNPIKNLTRNEWKLWIGSILVVIVSNIVTGDIDLLTYIPVVVNFAIFFLNDMYGLISWKKREIAGN